MAARRRSRARTTPGRLEARILRNAETLRDHPEWAAPACTGACPARCPYARARSDVKRVHDARFDTKALAKLARGGPLWKRLHPIATAYATLLLILDDGEVPFLSNTPTKAGPVPIVPRGKAPPAVNAGLQHFHDPHVRLLCAVDDLPRGAALFATDNGIVCAHDGTPPDGFLEEALKGITVNRVSPNLARCRHVRDDWTAGAYLEVDWTAASLRVRVCQACSQGNTASRLMDRAASREAGHGASVRVQLPRLVDPTGGEVPDAQPRLSAEDEQAYLGGRLEDAGLFERARLSRQTALAALSEPLVVVGDEAYRPRDSLVLEKVGVPPEWRPGFQAALRDVRKPVLLPKPSPTELLAALWADGGRAALDAIGGAGTADALYDATAPKERLGTLLDEAVRRRRRSELESALPAYTRVPAPADVLDAAVRARRSEGDAAAVRMLEKEARAGRRGAVAHAMLKAMGRAGHEFALTPHDAELAAHLGPTVRRALEAQGAEYDEALGELLALCGVSERPERAA